MSSVNSAHEWLNESNFLCDIPTGLGLVSTSRSIIPYRPKLKLDFIGDETSFVWKYFGFLKEDVEQNSLYCSLCNARFRFTKSTTCLVFHLENSHKIRLMDSSQDNESYEKRLWVNYLIYSFLVKDLLDPNIIEGVGFRDMMTAIVPDFVVPDKTVMVHQYISDDYFLKKMRLKKELQGKNSGMALSADLWGGCGTNFLTLTLHFLNDDWQKQTRILSTQVLPVSYEAKDILEAIRLTILEWELQDAIVVSEKNDCFLEAVEELELEHVGCFGHSLNEVVQQAVRSVPEVSGLINKCEQIITSVCESLGRKTDVELKFGCRLEKAFKSKTWSGDARTISGKEENWCTTLKLLRFILDNNESVVSFLRDDSQDLSFTLVDDSILRQLIDVLSFFETATEVLSSDQYPSLGLVYPAVKTLTAPRNESVLSSVKSVVVCFQKLLRKKLMSDRNWNRLYTASTALDPRFKVLLSDETIWEVLNREYQEKIQESDDTCKINSSDQSAKVPAENHDPSRKTKFMMLFSEILEKQKVSPTMTHIRALEDEVRVFHHYPVTPEEAATLNIYEWWKQKAHSFPLLAALARKILVIPATSVPSRVLFSGEKPLVNRKRNGLQPEMIDKMLFLHHNV